MEQGLLSFPAPSNPLGHILSKVLRALPLSGQDSGPGIRISPSTASEAASASLGPGPSLPSFPPPFSLAGALTGTQDRQG